MRVLLIPLVLFLPGYAIAAAIFAPRSITAADRLIYSFVFSLCATALAAICVQLVIPLGRATWLGILLLLTLGAGAVALGRHGPPALPRPRPGIPSLLGAAALAGSVALMAVAVTLSQESLADQRERSHYSELWMVPTDPGPVRDAGEAYTVGVRNHEGERAEYRLHLARDGRTLADWRLAIEPGAEWRREIEISGEDGLVVADLYRDGEVYRRNEVHLGGPG